MSRRRQRARDARFARVDAVYDKIWRMPLARLTVNDLANLIVVLDAERHEPDRIDDALDALTESLELDL